VNLDSWPPGLAHAARQAKHAGWVATLRAKSGTRQAVAAVRDPYYQHRYAGEVYEYAPGRFRRSFLDWDIAVPDATPQRLPRQVFCFWTGENDLTPARQASLQVMREVIAADVRLITPDNLAEIVVASSPLHPAYEHLSLTHRSDYLRAYVTHHHGGGYSDIKEPTSTWLASFEAMDADPEAWITGYPEHNSLWIARYPGKLGRELRRRHDALPGGGSFLARPGTRLSAEWLAEVERRLDYYGPLAQAHPGGIRGEDPRYPISWNRLSPQILHPLCLKFHAHVRVDPALKPVLVDYR
jgi:hypothetical protein